MQPRPQGSVPDLCNRDRKGAFQFESTLPCGRGSKFNPMKLPRDWPALVFVHAATMLLAGAAGWYAFTQGCATLPFQDEWPLLDDWQQSLHLGEWTWKHHNEHRYPLAKFLWITVLRATDYNFRAPMFLSVALQTSAAVLLLWTARGVRGSSRVRDALIPALLLHFGHAFTFAMGYQIGFAFLVYGLAGWLWTAGRLNQRGGWFWALLAGIFGSVVVQTGGFGIILTAALAPWAWLVARGQWKSGKRTSARILAAFAFIWIGYSTWIAMTTPKLLTQPTDRSLPTFLGSLGGYFANGFGLLEWGKFTVPLAVKASIATSVVFGTIGILLRGRFAKRFRGPFALALLTLLFGFVALAIVTAYARGYGFADRFAGPGAVLLIACGLVLVGSKALDFLPHWLSNAVGLLVAIGIVAMNVEPARRYGYYNGEVFWNFERDLQAGMPPVFLAGKYGGTMPIVMGDGLADSLRAYRRAGFGPFRRVADDPGWVPRPVENWNGPFVFESTEAELADGKPRTLHLPNPERPVVGIRLKISNAIPAGWQRLDLIGIDNSTGQDFAVFVFPPWIPAEMDLGFPLPKSCSNLRIVGVGIVRPFRIDTAEWMEISP